MNTVFFAPIALILTQNLFLLYSVYKNGEGKTDNMYLI